VKDVICGVWGALYLQEVLEEDLAAARDQLRRWRLQPESQLPTKPST